MGAPDITRIVSLSARPVVFVHGHGTIAERPHQTVRHRLRRFEELTGCDLNSSESPAEFWLALEAQDLGGRPA
jgi:hypothetical protein